MKTTIEVNGKPVTIELTKEQVEAISKAKKKITARVKTFEDACTVLGIKPEEALPVEMPEYLAASGDVKSIEAYCKLIIIARALNEGWEPDWDNSSQEKFYPWFINVSPGDGFSSQGYACDYSHAIVGSRLVFKSTELAEYAGKQFESIYNDYNNR